MCSFWRQGFTVLVFFLSGCLIVLTASSSAVAQLSNGAIIIPEFFEELYQVNQSEGTATDLLNSPSFEEVFGHNLEVVDENTAYITSFDELFRFNFLTGTITSVAELSFNPTEITLGFNGELIAVEPSEIFRIDPATGAETSLYTETFFGPSDAVVDTSGNIYLTEFFDALGVLTPSGNFSQIGNFSTNKFSHIDIGPDGFLYLSTTFGASFYRVDPTTGVGTELDSNVFTFIDDLQVDASGAILFAGVVDSKNGVFRFDPSTKELMTIVDDDTVNGGFFNPTDIAIFSGLGTFATADFDQNGTVDGADLAHLLDAFDLGPGGDVDGDNDTDGADVLAWQRQFNGNLNFSTNVVAVPEPNSASLLMVCVAISSVFWRRNNAHSW